MPKSKQSTNKDTVLRLSLACGGNKPEGFKGVDIVKTDDADYVQDLMTFPWTQFADNSVDEIECSNFVEHIPHGDSRDDPFFQFFDEIYRILKPAEFDPANPNIPIKGFARIVCPYYSSMRAWQDPTHQRAISESSFLYVNKQWRIDNKLDHYPVSCDFDFNYGYVMTPEWQNRNQETQAFAIKHYINVISDIQVQLIKRPETA
ncbi:MAG TPA: hypothetical protein VK497_05005 [Candidatus Saccharimonadales bacterium]|nr:hypothetical protein [Candidatus Saccharimonadales bacterium]